jgi:hypothetical protein
MQKKFGQRQIPTLFGLAILVLSLIGGIALIGSGGGVFAPRAAPQTTPKNVKITNVKDNSFTISFMTDESTTGFIKYGTEPTAIRLQASDDRDQLSGNVGQFTTHYITVRDLQPNTSYYYTLGTASTPKFDNNGEPFTVKTAARGGNPPNAKTIYGVIQTASGTAAHGAIVYVTIPGAGPLSSLTKDGSGSWAIPLSTARTTDGSQYAVINPTDQISIFVQGPLLSQTTTKTVPVEQAQPAETIKLGQSSETTTEAPPALENANQTESLNPTSTTQSTLMTETTTSSPSATEAQIATQVPADTTTTQTEVDLKADQPQEVQTTQPTITGEAPPNTTLTVEIHSDEQITTTVKTDATGNFAIDLAALEKQLEPGEHTVTISYVDPTTKKTVTETKTFTVAAGSSTLLAQANTSPKPFGSGNPFTIESPTPTPSPSPTASASAQPRISVPASSSATPKSGSVTTTFFLLIAGGFFLLAGAWTTLHNGKLLKGNDPFSI